MRVSHGSRTDQTGLLEHAKVLGDRRLSERQLGEDVGSSALGLSSQQTQDVKPSRVGQRFRDSSGHGVIHWASPVYRQSPINDRLRRIEMSVYP